MLIQKKGHVRWDNVIADCKVCCSRVVLTTLDQPLRGVDVETVRSVGHQVTTLRATFRCQHCGYKAIEWEHVKTELIT